MEKLTQSYVIASMQNHPRALQITKVLSKTRMDLTDIGIELTDETMQTMAQDAWQDYAKFMNKVVHGEA